MKSANKVYAALRKINVILFFILKICNSFFLVNIQNIIADVESSGGFKRRAAHTPKFLEDSEMLDKQNKISKEIKAEYKKL